VTECGRSVEPRILPLHSRCSMWFEAKVDRRHLTALESVDSGHCMALNSWPLSGSLLISMNVMKRARRRWPPACNLIGSLRHGRTSAHTNVYDRFWSIPASPSARAADPVAVVRAEYCASQLQTLVHEASNAFQATWSTEERSLQNAIRVLRTRQPAARTSPEQAVTVACDPAV